MILFQQHIENEHSTSTAVMNFEDSLKMPSDYLSDACEASCSSHRSSRSEVIVMVLISNFVFIVNINFQFRLIQTSIDWSREHSMLPDSLA